MRKQIPPHVNVQAFLSRKQIPCHVNYFLTRGNSRVPSSRESRGEIYFSGKSGKVRQFVPFLRIQGKSGNYFLPRAADWSGKVREFCSDSDQTLCNFLYFVAKYVYHESNFSQIFLATLHSASLKNSFSYVLHNILLFPFTK